MTRKVTLMQSTSPQGAEGPDSPQSGPFAVPSEDDGYGYCNSCGEEMWIADDCCEDGEWVPHGG